MGICPHLHLAGGGMICKLRPACRWWWRIEGSAGYSSNLHVKVLPRYIRLPCLSLTRQC
jgi:hypothetical protein